MKKLFLLSLIILAIVSCKDETAGKGNIYGIVTVKETAEPMRATGVELYYNGSLLLKTVTYDDGHYEFENLQTGEYDLKVVATGYVDCTYSVIVESGRTARADMQLEKINTYMSVQTSSVTEISGNSVVLNGSYKSWSSNEYSSTNTYISYAREVGFYYSQNANNMLVENNRVTATFKDHSIHSSSYHPYGDGEFFVDINNLVSGKWYVRAYASNDYGIEFGEIQSFEISGTPIVRTLGVSNVTANTATLNAIIDYAGEPVYTERGFVYSSVFPNPTIDDPVSATKKVIVSGNAAEFSANVIGLTDSTTYYVCAYVISNNIPTYGGSVKFSNGGSSEYIVLEQDGLMVQASDISAGATYSEATNLCKSSSIGGYSDWRLPTLGECSGPLYEYRDELILKVNDEWWTQTYNSNGYYYVYNFLNGSQTYRGTSSKKRVRCVRTK